MIDCGKFEWVMQYFCRVNDWLLALISSPVNFPLVKPSIGQLSPDKASPVSSLIPKSKL